MRPVVSKFSRTLLSYQSKPHSASHATQHGWVHAEWLRKITTKSTGTEVTDRRAAAAEIHLSTFHASNEAVQAEIQEESHEILHRVTSKESTFDSIPIFGLRPLSFGANTDDGNLGV